MDRYNPDQTHDDPAVQELIREGWLGEWDYPIDVDNLVGAAAIVRKHTPRPSLAEVLRAEFTDTELHGFIVAAEHPNNRGASHWEKLRRAAIEAANCADCASTRP